MVNKRYIIGHTRGSFLRKLKSAVRSCLSSAEQFAKDSGARIGGIRSANQGVVDISNRDQGSPQVKKVRVVTTVEYFLRD